MNHPVQQDLLLDILHAFNNCASKLLIHPHVLQRINHDSVICYLVAVSTNIQEQPERQQRTQSNYRVRKYPADYECNPL
jgi:hypothetical protein